MCGQSYRKYALQNFNKNCEQVLDKLVDPGLDKKWIPHTPFCTGNKMMHGFIKRASVDVSYLKMMFLSSTIRLTCNPTLHAIWVRQTNLV